MVRELTIEEHQQARKRRERDALRRLRQQETMAVVRAMLGQFEMPKEIRWQLEIKLFNFLFYSCPGDVLQSLREQCSNARAEAK